MATNYDGSRDPRRGAGLQTRVPRAAESGLYSTSLQFSHAELAKIDSKITTLLGKGALNVSGQFFNGLFLVPKRKGKSRLVINLKKLNVFLRYDHFKMEGIYLLRDLKDAYFVIPVWKDHRKYLRFLWKGFLLMLVFFGLTAAPRLYTKVPKQVVALLRRARIRLIIYLDELLFMNQSKESLGLDTPTARYLLENLGFVINLEKSGCCLPSGLQGGVNQIPLQLSACPSRSLFTGLPIYGEVDCFYTSNLSCPSTLSSPSSSQTPSFSGAKWLRCNNSSVEKGQGGVTLVVSPSERFERSCAS